MLSRNFVVFILAALAMIAAGHVPLPGIDLDKLASPNAMGGRFVVPQVSIFALGLQPIYTAFLIAEIGKLFISPRHHDLDKRAEPTILLVRLIALGIAALLAYDIAVAFESRDLIKPDFAFFMPVAIASFVAATAFALYLVDQVRLAGFSNGFWALFAVDIALGLSASFGQTWDLMRVGAVSFELVLGGLVYIVVCIAAILFITSLWQGLGDDGEDGQPMPRGILIWPISLSVYLASMLLADVAYWAASFAPDLVGRSPIVMLNIFAVLMIPLFVFGYARRSRMQVSSPVRLTIVVSLIAVVQVALFVSPIFGDMLLSGLPFVVGAPPLLALVLTAIGIGALKVPALFPERRDGRPADVN